MDAADETLAVQRHANLRAMNSFGLPAVARALVCIRGDADVRRLLAHPELGRWPKFVLGGGSNMVLSRDPPG
ncbi:MAG: UDP-N-acetylenolpyruvoylglucosamine reductase, partial [Rubrivivax sp.]|nr:UDP-N-acetylenolpyruvoylglucosamine reductase [Rubrivivax sp.]